MTDTDPRPTRTAVRPLVRRAVALEAAMWRSLFRWVFRRPPDLSPDSEPFSYAGVVKPILWVFIGVSAVEVPLLDVILRHTVSWGPARAIALTIGIYGLIWMIGLLATLLLHPHVIDDAGLRIRGGTSIDLTVPWHAIAAIHTRYRSLPSSRSVQYDRTDDGVILNLGTASQTSVDIRFHHPMVVSLPKGPSEPATEVRFYADEPEALASRARLRMAAHCGPGAARP